MEKLINLDQISKEKRKKIEEILKENEKKMEGEIPGIEVDGSERFTEHISNNRMSPWDVNPKKVIDGYEIQQRRLKGKLNEHDKETYRQLNAIHEDGISSFWLKIKNVVDSRKEIDMRGISDKIDPSDEWMMR